MPMITEDYVSFETAKLLKEKGFNIPVRYEYHNAVHMNQKPQFHERLHNFNVEEYSGLHTKWYSAPTIQMAMKWLRIEHNIFVCVLLLEESNEFGYTIENLIKKKYITTSKNSSYKDPEEACEAAIKYCLENLI